MLHIIIADVDSLKQRKWDNRNNNAVQKDILKGPSVDITHVVARWRTVKMATDTVVTINHRDDLYCSSTGAFPLPPPQLLGNKFLGCIGRSATPDLKNEILQKKIPS